MLFICLIGYDPSIPTSQDDPKSLQPQHAAVEREMREAGVYVSGGALMPPEIVPIVRIRRGTIEKIDGPFTESKEVLGGYFLIDCADEQTAVDWASKIPTNSREWVDMRPMPLFHPNLAREGGRR